MDIVVPAGAISVASVILAFIINQALAYFGVNLSETLRKGIVFVVAVGLTGYYGFQAGLPLPDPAVSPMEFAGVLLAYATAVFKVAQVVYDKLWQALLAA